MVVTIKCEQVQEVQSCLQGLQYLQVFSSGYHIMEKQS